MMKKTLFTTIILIASAAVFANPVGKDRAARVATNTVVRMNAAMHGTKAGATVELTDISATMCYDLLHIFQYRYGDVEGFVIVSGDDMTDPVLAFSDEGLLTGTNPAFEQQLQHYCNEIAEGRKKNLQAPRHVADKWRRMESADMTEAKGDMYNDVIRRLLGDMRWGQSAPYNTRCPGGSVTGCVATAFGMIMNYWDYPEHGFGTHSYNGSDNPAAYPNWRYGILSADFEHTYYSWDKMPDYLFVNSDTAEIRAVSTLLFHIGVSLDMHYTPSGSGCWSLPEYAIFDTLLHLSPDMGADTRIPKHFGYKYDYAGLRDSIGNDTLWLEMLYRSIADSMPVYYAGWAKDNSPAGHSGTSGHGFLLDGYFSDEVDSNMFHINWGWNGSADALFKLDAMTPNGSDFTQWHGAIIGIRPDTSYHGYDYLGIEPKNPIMAQIAGLEGRLVVTGAGTETVAVYDLMGRCVATRGASGAEQWQVCVPRGIYLVRVGNAPAQKAIVY